MEMLKWYVIRTDSNQILSMPFKTAEAAISQKSKMEGMERYRGVPLGVDERDVNKMQVHPQPIPDPK